MNNINILRRFLFPLFFIIASLSLKGQVPPVRGTITDCETGEPLIGINILVSGSPQGAVTDLNGNYNIGRLRQGDVLIIPYPGYQTKRIIYQGGVEINVCLSRNNEDTECWQFVTFNTLTNNTRYNQGTSFTSGSIPMDLIPFVWGNGNITTSGFARVDNRQYSGGSGLDININNVNIRLNIASQINEISFDAGHWGGNMNLKINGVFKNFGRISSINNTSLGGVSISTTGDYNTPGKWIFRGDISSFEVGGQELWIDNICIKRKETSIRGTVTDCETGEPLIGATILVKGTSQGTVADFGGNYILEPPEGLYELVYSYTGYQTKEITYQGESEINVCLNKAIEEDCDQSTSFEDLPFARYVSEGFTSNGINFFGTAAVVPLREGNLYQKQLLVNKVEQLIPRAASSISFDFNLIRIRNPILTFVINDTTYQDSLSNFLSKNIDGINFNGKLYESTGELTITGNILSIVLNFEGLIIDNYCVIYNDAECRQSTNFNDLVNNTRYNSGTSFTTGNLSFDLVPFVWENGNIFSGGNALVDNNRYGGGNGLDIYTDNVNLRFNLNSQVNEISFDAGHWGGNMNLKINGEFKNFRRISSINNTSLGGVSISATGDYNVPGRWTFSGVISSFEVGGQELWIDNICIKGEDECTFDPDFEYEDCSDAFTLLFDEDPNISESNGYQYQFFIDSALVYTTGGTLITFDNFFYYFGETGIGKHTGRLIVTDASGCVAEIEKDLYVFPEPPEPLFTVDDSDCAAGVIQLDYTIPVDLRLPSNTLFHYSWVIITPNGPLPPIEGVVQSGIALNENITSVGSGPYLFTLTIQYEIDGVKIGCENYHTEVKNYTESLLSITTSLSNENWCGANFSTDLTVDVSGGNQPYEYSINGGLFQPLNVFTNLTSANYTIRVRDNSGCEVTTIVGIDETIERPRISGLCASPGSCNNSASSIPVNIRFTASNGNPAITGTFNYDIIRTSDNQVVHNSSAAWGSLASATISNIIGGTSLRIRISQDLSGFIDVATCPIQSSSITVPELTVDASVVTPGPFGVCTDTETITYTLSATPRVADATHFCGSYPLDEKLVFDLQKRVNGSYSSIQSVSNIVAGADQNFIVTGPGMYRIGITYDESGFNCTRYISFDVKKKNALIIDTYKKDITCYGYANGVISVNVSGQITGTLSLIWMKIGDPFWGFKQGHAHSGLGPGTYRISISDESGCPGKIITHTITQPSKLAIPIIVHPLNSCDLSAELTISGTPSYDFIWQQINPQNQIVQRDLDVEVIAGIATSILDPPSMSGSPVNAPQPGDYIVQVIDANGCQETSIPYTFEYPKFAHSYELNFRWKSVEIAPPPPRKNPNPPVRSYSQKAGEIQQKIANQIIECEYNVQEGIQQGFAQKCFSTDYLSDELKLIYPLDYDFYTLYYYDRIGNLVRTVSPKGVDTSAVDRGITPIRHNFITSYDYNSLGQQIKKTTPDAGTTQYLYNDLNQLRFSQNARQADINDVENINNSTRYAYTKYDPLGRIIEAGEAQLAANEEFISTLDKKDLLQENPDFPNSNTDEEIYIIYNNPAPNLTYLNLPDKEQSFLENRISYTYHKNLGEEEVYTYFSYDAHGNITWEANKIPQLQTSFTGYEYDLTSGNILRINYQDGFDDQFFHRYKYDENNRIISVETSFDGILWDKDTRYNFFEYGPLKSIEVGEYGVQKTDYTYTINGWLKAINTPDLSETPLEGFNKQFSRDLFGMSLGYFKGDFQRENSVINSSYKSSTTFILENNRPLFNGNISYWINQNGFRNNEDPFDEKIVGQSFSFDILNRLTKSENYLFSTNGDSDIDPKYESSYSYDKNGNFLTLSRNGGDSGQLEMDNLTFNYYNNSNKVSTVIDAIGSESYNEDFPTGQTIDNENYIFDASGNLIEDKQEGLQFRWNNLGKLSEVIPNIASTGETQKPYIKFLYNSDGLRVQKHTSYSPFQNGTSPQISPENSKTLFYSKNHIGETNAIYELETTSGENGLVANYKIAEYNIIGDKRNGIANINKTLSRNEFELDEYENLDLNLARAYALTLLLDKLVGRKQYEIKDHLFNPRVVVSDKKIHRPYSEFDQDLIATYNYYPYGMLQPGRFAELDSYRYGFTGSEKDNELKGNGNSYSYNERIYDPRIGLWGSVDPLSEEFPGLSPYIYAAGNPIWLMDEEGDIPKASATIKEYWPDMPPFVEGMMDGLQENFALSQLWDLGELGYNLASDPEFRDQFIAGLQAIADDPVKFVKSMGEEYVQKVQNVMTWNQQGQYDAGYLSGEIAVNALTGAAVLKIISKLNPCGCFTEGTLVYMETGYKPLNDIEIGENVWAYNDTTEEYSLKPVIDKFSLTREGIYELYIDDQVIEVSSDHPFFVNGKWKNVEDLKVNDKIKTFYGEYLSIDNIIYYPGNFRVYNLTIDDFHTYYVTNSSLLVHNVNCFIHRVSKKRHPEAAQHVEDYYTQFGEYPTGTIDRAGASSRRRERIKPDDRVKGMDVDEQPPAVLKPESPVSKRPINRSDNRGDGASLGNALRGQPEGTKVQIRVDENN